MQQIIHQHESWVRVLTCAAVTRLCGQHGPLRRAQQRRAGSVEFCELITIKVGVLVNYRVYFETFDTYKKIDRERNKRGISTNRLISNLKSTDFFFQKTIVLFYSLSREKKLEQEQAPRPLQKRGVI